jgi:hypothetical protein
MVARYSSGEEEDGRWYMVDGGWWIVDHDGKWCMGLTIATWWRLVVWSVMVLQFDLCVLSHINESSATLCVIMHARVSMRLSALGMGVVVSAGAAHHDGGPANSHSVDGARGAERAAAVLLRVGRVVHGRGGVAAADAPRRALPRRA